LQQQIGITEYHIEKTQIWCDHIGRWKTNIISVDISISDSIDTDPVPHFVIQVKLFDNLNHEDGLNEGWIIIRTLKQFQSLHQRLVEMSENIGVKYKKLPTINRNLLTKTYDENRIMQIKATLDDYLQVFAVYKFII
jgi:sorting nexin-25